MGMATERCLAIAEDEERRLDIQWYTTQRAWPDAAASAFAQESMEPIKAGQRTFRGLMASLGFVLETARQSAP